MTQIHVLVCFFFTPRALVFRFTKPCPSTFVFLFDLFLKHRSLPSLSMRPCTRVEIKITDQSPISVSCVVAAEAGERGVYQ